VYLEWGRNRLVDLDDLGLEIRLLLLELAIDPLLHTDAGEMMMTATIEDDKMGKKNRRERLTLDSSKDLTSSAAAAAFLPPDLAKTSLILGRTLDFQISMVRGSGNQAGRCRGEGHDSYGREQQASR
jgi:hypothetical protein